MHTRTQRLGVSLTALAVATATISAGWSAGMAAAEPTDATTVSISNGGTTAHVSDSFPQVVSYQLGQATLSGQRGIAADSWTINGTAYSATTTAETSADSIRYTSVIDGLEVSITSTITVGANGAVTFTVTSVSGADAAQVNTLALPGQAFLSGTAAEGTVLDRTVVNPDSTKNADEHISVVTDTAVGTKGAAYAFLGNGSLIGSVISNATTQNSSGPASWDTRLQTSITGTDTKTAAISSNAWLVHPTGATDPRVTSYEAPTVTVVLTGDRNGDGIVNWQDGGIAYRAVDTPRMGSERVAERVVNRIAFNFASQATNYSELVLENTKRVANSTDGLGQWVLNKGYGSEGHDSANTDYGGNYNERAGGLKDFNTLVDAGQALNADMAVHVNATEIYPQANSFDSAILSGTAPYSPGWSWLDQSFYINQQVDLGSGRILDRFAQLKKDVPNLNGVYIDVYYSNGWTAEETANKVNDLGLEVSTEWSDKFVDNAVWAHWPNDLNYGGATNKGVNSTMVRFMQNGQADIWNNDPLLGQQRLVDAEGWTGNRNWNGFVDNIWQQSLPTKFIQHFDLLTYQANTHATLTDDVTISLDGQTRVITMGGAEVLRGDSYLLPWQSLSSNEQTGSPVNADKMYFYTATGGSKTFGLTKAFSAATSFTVYELGDQGRTAVGKVTASNGSLTLTGKAGVAYVVVPDGSAQPAAASYGTAQLADPGFNAGNLTAWNPTGEVSIATTAVGTNKNQSAGDHIASFGPAASSISQKVTGLTAGQRYSVSAQVQIAATALREVTLSADAAGTISSRSWSLSPTANRIAADSKADSYAQRASVSFTAPASGEVTVSLAAAAGASVVTIDNVRVMTDTSAATAAGTVYSQDFEGNQPGWGPFIKAGAGGTTDPRTSISQVQDPYTSKQWRNTARPFNDGPLAGLAIDTTISGQHSLMSHSENSGLVYRTDPSQLSLKFGHSYRFAFDYQVGQVGSYRFVQGTDRISDGQLVTAVSSTRDLAQALTNAQFTHEFTVGCGDYTWVGIERVGGPDVDLAVDNITVTDLGEAPGGPACATVAVPNPILNPGSDSVISTTFTNSETVPVSNVGLSLEAPTGYGVKVAEGSSNLATSVAPGETVRTQWVVNSPAGAAGSTAALNLSATYVADCQLRTVTSHSTAQVSLRPRIPNQQISVTASSEETDAGPGEGPAALVLDGNAGTIWHSRYSVDATSYPHWLLFDLGSATAIDGIGYLRRAANTNGPIKGYTVEVSSDGETYTEVAAGQWQDLATWQDVSFAQTTARYIKVTALSSISGTQFAAAAEMAIYGPDSQVAGSAPLPRPADDPSACQPPAGPSIAVSSPVRAGAGTTATLANHPAGKVTLWLGTEKKAVATALVGEGGSAMVKFTVPAKTKAGVYPLVVKAADGTELSRTDVTVTRTKR